MRRGSSLPCPFGRCNLKCNDIFQHFFKNHQYISVGSDVPLYYRLKNITKDIFIVYQSQNDVFFVVLIEDSYQKNIHFEVYVVYNYAKKCCGYPKFVYNIPRVVKNQSIELYRSKHSMGRSSKSIEICKDDLKKFSGSKLFYDIEIKFKKMNWLFWTYELSDLFVLMFIVIVLFVFQIVSLYSLVKLYFILNIKCEIYWSFFHYHITPICRNFNILRI